MKIHKHIFFVATAIIMLAGCVTWHQKYISVYNHFQSGNLEKADELLANDDKLKDGKNRILYLLDRGVLNHMLGNYEQSIEFFKEADIIIEDYKKKIGTEALVLISNPMARPYMPEDFEIVMINFYQSMNFIALGKWENALVECRRANIKLNELNDKYKDHKNRYQRDAFIHLLMGLIYDAQKDYNNAFIAYRNAFEIYESDYLKNFEVGVPEQLKYDIVRTAYKTGFFDEVQFYEDKFGIKYEAENPENGNLVFFWLNGLGPVKSEWGVTLTKMEDEFGMISFVNEEMDMNFAFPLESISDDDQSKLSDLSFTRIPFPKYSTRPPVYQQAWLQINDSIEYPVELSENINAIAFKVINDRMFRELGNTILRVAVKKAIENKVRDKDKNLGFLVGLVNTATEKADTRNWQTLPFSVSYSRISLPEGNHQLTLNTTGDKENNNYDLNVTIKKGVTYFKTFHTIDSYPYIP